MDGFEVQSRLTRTDAHVPVVMITGLHTSGGRERAMERGATAYLPKPVDAQVLLDTIATVIARARGPRRLTKAERDKLRTRKPKPATPSKSPPTQQKNEGNTC